MGVATVLLVPLSPNWSPVLRTASLERTVDLSGFAASGDRMLPDLAFFVLKLNPVRVESTQVMKLLGATDSPASSDGNSLSTDSACQWVLTGNGQMLRIFMIRLAGSPACGSGLNTSCELF